MTDLSQKITVLTLLPRRTMLKGTAGILAAGMFPAIHAQEKITLRYLGTAVNQDKAIGEKFAYEDAINKAWPLEGYLLAEEIFQRNK